jgi:hypothetical protein
MPCYLKEIDTISELAGFKSVLIVPCRFCPAASLAVSKNEPYIELFRGFLKTASYEKTLSTMKSRLEKKGVKTGVFKSNLLHQFVLCMWTSKRRNELIEKAKKYEALVVMGCDAAVQAIQDSVKSISCQVVQGMKTEGLMIIKPKFHLSCNISLELENVTPTQKGDEAISTDKTANTIPSACMLNKEEVTLAV